MRDAWKSKPSLELDLGTIRRMLKVALSKTALKAELVSGGLSNTTYRVRLAGGDDVAVRVLTRDPAAAEREYRLSQMLPAGALMPRVLHHEPIGLLHHPYVVSEWKSGYTLQRAADRWAASSQSVGRCLAEIHSISLPRSGFLGPDLTVAQPVDFGAEDLLNYMHSCFGSGVGRERLTPDIADRLLELISRNVAKLREADLTACLVHGDFGGSNILVSGPEGGDAVTAILDWEFTLSGNPLLDFGNLLRHPFGDDPAFSAGVAEGYRASGRRLPDNWFALCHVFDLYSWGYFLSLPEPGESLTADAQRTIVRTMAMLEAGW